MTHRFIRLPEVKNKTGYKATAIHDKIKKGEFPKPISLGTRAVAWLESEVDDWIASRIRASREIGGSHASR